MDDAEHDVLAFMAFPKEHWSQGEGATVASADADTVDYRRIYPHMYERLGAQMEAAAGVAS